MAALVLHGMGAVIASSSHFKPRSLSLSLSLSLFLKQGKRKPSLLSSQPPTYTHLSCSAPYSRRKILAALLSSSFASSFLPR